MVRLQRPPVAAAGAPAVRLAAGVCSSGCVAYRPLWNPPAAAGNSAGARVLPNLQFNGKQQAGCDWITSCQTYIAVPALLGEQLEIERACGARCTWRELCSAEFLRSAGASRLWCRSSLDAADTGRCVGRHLGLQAG